ncbi:MAG: 30S ribosomal protein S18 [Planctomycetota bacterium]
MGRPAKLVHTSANGVEYVDWKDAENLRRAMTPNGKIYGRKRLSTSAREQKLVAQAIKRARFMGLLPYTSATL